jgi:hypothetical protein
MLSYVMVGANDLPRSGKFYTAILVPLGYEKKEAENKLVFSLPDTPDRYNGPGAVYVTKPYDGREATVGNGSMVAFRAQTHDLGPVSSCLLGPSFAARGQVHGGSVQGVAPILCGRSGLSPTRTPGRHL